jgi:sulfur-oxidizing protein SoxX
MRLNTKLTSVPLALAALILSQSALSMSGSVDEQSKKEASPQTEIAVSASPKRSSCKP